MQAPPPPLDALPRPVGFVLGGGGSLGATQVGMLQALGERRAAPDLVVGTSVGSLNGAVLAADPVGAANRLSHVWARTTRERVFPGGLLAQTRLLHRAKTHLFPNSGLAATITDFVGESTTFHDLAVPFAAVATDIGTARPVVVRDGPLLPALLASAAIPGVFPAVDVAGRPCYDGGLVANIPMRQAVEAGARSLVVLDCGFPGPVPTSTDDLAEILLYTLAVGMRAQSALEAPLIAADVPVVYLRAPATRLISPLDFSHTAELIEAGYASTRSFLDDLHVTGPGLYGRPSP